MSILIGSDDAQFIGASIHEVLVALGVSLVLVVLVIWGFLLSLRATMVPAITIPISLIGCFVLISAFGFSINVLTLLALLLAIGLVVDDAIVMLDNIKRRIDLGESPLVASARGARSEEHTSELQSLMRISYAVFCLKKKHNKTKPSYTTHILSTHI